MRRITKKARKEYRLDAVAPLLTPSELRVLLILRERPGEWHGAVMVAAMTGLSVPTARRAARHLYHLELLEEDGYATRAFPLCWTSLDRRSWNRVERLALSSQS